jgi:hypothetical protein
MMPDTSSCKYSRRWIINLRHAVLTSMQAALMLLLTLQHAHHQLLTGVPILQRRLATAGKVVPKLLCKKKILFIGSAP